ncbi:MAG: hypothetical protein ACNA8L_13300 [Luteolibacter sp.]|jgi:hypothetical protein
MKIISYFVVFLFFLAGNVFAEYHAFTSADGQRSFQGVVLDYDRITEVVTVRNDQGQTIRFRIDLVSEKDREFVKTHEPKINAVLDVRFERLVDRQDSNRSKTQRVTNYEAGYKINLLSYTPQDLDNVEVEYLLIYRKDSVSGDAETQTVRGSGSVRIPANGAAELETSTVNLTDFYKQGTVSRAKSGCSSCPKSQKSSVATRAQRSRDSLTGCIARVKINGEVVSVTATAPNLLRQFEKELDSKY